MVAGTAAADLAGTGSVALGSRASGNSAERFTLYSRAEDEQYINNQDDRARGKGNNPFGNYRDTSPAQQKSPNGPFPGDEAIFSFNLYSNPSLKTRDGIAVLTCTYDVNKNALCDEVFRLKTGKTLLAEGSFAFDAKTFTLVVTGGYDGYPGNKGTVTESPSTNHAERLGFKLA